MSSPLRLLLVEDNPDDAELVLAELHRRGCPVEAQCVELLADVHAALAGGPWDVVLSDFGLPGHDGLDVLRAVREHDPDLPFLFVSGSIGEEVAVAAMRAGAHDYVLKDNLTRLAPAVLREVKDAADRRHHRRTADALRVMETRLRRVFESSMLGMVFWRQDGTVLDANAEYLRLTGFSTEDLREGRINWRSLVPAHFVDVQAAIHRELEAHGISAAAEMQIRTKQGDLRPVLIGSVVLGTSPEEGAAFVMDMAAAVADREARRALEEQLRQAQKMELVARLAGGVAHDFNNLLSVVILSAGLARDDGPEALWPFLDDITGAAQQGAALTRQLLALGRRQTLVTQSVNLNELIRSQESLLRRLGGEQVEIVLDLDADLDAVTADATQLEQVLLNLCVNARDAMPTGGRLTVHTENVDLDEPVHAPHGAIPSGTYAVVAVADSGSGMTRETMARVFEPFFSTKAEGKGTGLGLAVVHGIVAQSGGHIAVYSEVGLGTTVRVYLPRLAGRGAPRVTDVVKESPTAKPGEVVLLAEDEPSLRRAATQALERAGYRVFAAADAIEAQAIADRHLGRLHLLVTDVVMPGLTGPELFEQLRRHRPNLRVLFASGYLPDNLSRQGAAVLDGRFLPKPFTMADLARKVRTVLDAS